MSSAFPAWRLAICFLDSRQRHRGAAMSPGRSQGRPEFACSRRKGGSLDRANAALTKGAPISNSRLEPTRVERRVARDAVAATEFACSRRKGGSLDRANAALTKGAPISNSRLEPTRVERRVAR